MSAIITLEERLISASLNSAMVLNFVMGIYTMVYFGTVYLYFTNGGNHLQRRIVLSSLTALYILCALYCGVQWYLLQWTMVDNGATRNSIAVASVEGPPALYVVLLVTQNIMLIISDGLLLWRCFHLWNMSWRVIAFPLFLTISEIPFLIPVTYFRIHQDPLVFNSLSSSIMFISSASTIITTALIGYRVYGASSNITGNKAKRRLRNIFHVLFESAALYGVLVLINAITDVSPDTGDSLFYFISIYTGVLLPIIAGLAPTILVARVITARSDETDLASITQISGLQFQSQQVARQNRTEITASQNLSGSGRVHVFDLESESVGLDKIDDERDGGRYGERVNAIAANR